MIRNAITIVAALALLGVLAWYFLVIWPQLAEISFARNKGARMRSDLRILHLAMDEFMAEHGAPPARLSQLTTPTPHIWAVPRDPFAGAVGYDVTYETDGVRWRAYSRGPDRDDDGGLVFYDITNGVLSDGDIVRVGPTPALWTDEIPGIEGQGLLSVPQGTRVPTH